MKILYIFSSYSNFCPYFQQWLNELTKPKYSKYKIGLLFRLTGRIDQLPVKDHISYFPFKEFKSKINIINILVNRFRIENLKRELILFDANIIHLHGCYSTYLAKMPLSLKGQLVFNVWGNDFNTQYYLSKKYRNVFQKLFEKSKVILTNWYIMAESIGQEAPDFKTKIITIPWGIEKSFFEKVKSIEEKRFKSLLGIDDQKVVITSMKGATPNSNLDTMIRAFAELDDISNVVLIIHAAVGDQGYLKQIEQLIEELNISQKVILSRQNLNQDDFIALMKITDLALILPSKDQFTRSIFEAIISGSKIILSDIPPYKNLPDIFKIDIPLINPRSEKELSQVLRYEILKENSKKTAQDVIKVLKNNFLFEKQIDKIFEQYNNIIIKEEDG